MAVFITRLKWHMRPETGIHNALKMAHEARDRKLAAVKVPIPRDKLYSMAMMAFPAKILTCNERVM